MVAEPLLSEELNKLLVFLSKIFEQTRYDFEGFKSLLSYCESHKIKTSNGFYWNSLFAVNNSPIVSAAPLVIVAINITFASINQIDIDD